MSNVSIITWRGPPSDDPPPPITPEAGDAFHHDTIRIGSYMGGVEPPLVPHRHRAQTSVVSSERTKCVSTTNDTVQLPGAANHTATTGIVGKR